MAAGGVWEVGLGRTPGTAGGAGGLEVLRQRWGAWYRKGGWGFAGPQPLVGGAQPLYFDTWGLIEPLTPQICLFI